MLPHGVLGGASIEHGRKFQLEMGGKNPFVVLDDADLTVAVEAAVNSAFFSTGQRCTASSRLIVTKGVHDKFMAALRERLKNIVVDDTPFGLSSGIATTNLKHATHFKRNAEAGMVMVNLPTAGVDFHVPFGGRKSSSYGSREQGKYAAEFFTTVKTAYTLP